MPNIWLEFASARPTGKSAFTFSPAGTPGVMQFCLYLLLLVAFECTSCEPPNIEALRKDVEEAFSSKSFLSIEKKYGDSKVVEVILENEYDEDNPKAVLKFNSISELSKWFLEKHQFNENMIIPAPVFCRDQGCRYQLPELTLHHGKYLLGFDSRTVGRCTSLTRVRICWG